MHLRSRCLPRPSASSPLDNRAHPMANTSQALDQEGLYHEIHGMAKQIRMMNENNARLIQLLATANPPSSAAPPIPDIERSHRSRRSGDHSQNHSTESRSSSKTSRVEGEELRRGRSPRRNDRPGAEIYLLLRKSEIWMPDSTPSTQGQTFRLLGKGNVQGFFYHLKGNKKLPPGTIDSFGDLSRLFVANFMSCRIRQKNASHLFTVHQKETENLKDYVKRFNQAILEVEDSSNKVVIMAMMEGLRSADKYIAAEELAEAKCRRQGRDDPKRKEPDSKQPEYRDEARSKRSNRHSRCLLKSNMRNLSSGLEKLKLTPDRETGTSIVSFTDHRHNTEDCFQLKEQIAILIKKVIVDTHPPITFNNDDLRGLHLPHDNAFVVSVVIANFNVQRILVDNESSADILFISAFKRMKIGLDKLHPFHTPMVSFRGNMTHPLGWIKLLVTLGTEPHQITVWQDFIVVDCPSPYNAILGRSTLGGTRAITSTYHLKMKFPTSTKVGEIDSEMEALRYEVEHITLTDPRETENTKPLEEIAPVPIHPDYPDRHVMIGTELTDELRSTLTNCLKRNFDVFAWS
ncbi:hypothetical protein Acr_00g0051020 [Actinidia rufa]|uniref:Retrotransposon gag domain-containing protein n=1 Tax=Actinidia rufa TaxID=165716 RepID=A0A7J0DMA4_9ERIC|nr:hypothetical protein Acr_00g0051020 [Actinidia rufa]